MKTVHIIGAGPAGLTAAYELLRSSNERDWHIVLLEASDTFGGISRTVRHNGNRMDIGGHRFFSKDERVTKWWQDMLPLQGRPSMDDLLTGRAVDLSESGPDPERCDEVMLSRRRISRIYYRKKFFAYPVRMDLNTIHNMGLMTTVAAGLSYLASTVKKLPETSLENFYINRFGRKLYSMFFESYTEKLWGRHPRDISSEWGAQRVKGLSIRAVLKDALSKCFPGRAAAKRQVETSLIEEFCYPKFGPGQLWELTAEKIADLGGEIRMNARVTGVTTANGRVRSVRYVQNGELLEEDTDVVISSMPLCDLVAGMNDVPEDVARIAAGLPYRDFVTVGLLVDRLELKNDTKIKTVSDIIPDCWIYVQDGGVKLGRIQVFNNWSPYMVRDPINTIWIGLEYFCREGDEYWSMSSEQWKAFAVKELVGMGILRQDSSILDHHMERVCKAYPAYFDSYAQIGLLRGYLDGFDNLYCIGRNGQHRYNNMDHSMATAFEAVGNILSGRRDKSNIWNVNTDQEYHETKRDQENG